jgi:hypothetical protein
MFRRRKSLILDGEMLERSIRHAWKAWSFVPPPKNGDRTQVGQAHVYLTADASVRH